MSLTKFIDEQGKPLIELLDLLPMPVFYKNREGIYLGCNKAFERAINLSKEEVIGKTVFQVSSEPLAKIHFEKDNELFDNPGIQIYDGKLTLRNGDSSIFRYHKATFTNEKGEVTGIIGAAFNIKQEKVLEGLASYDPLTNLYNRRVGLEMLESSMVECRSRGGKLSLVVMDVDHFKEINDTYGHSFGDEVLKKISQVLEDNLRKEDIVFRYGGEEFVYALPFTGRKEAFLASERIRRDISAVFKGDDKRIKKQISASFGIAVFPDNGDDINKLMEKADSAMYRVKKNGRNGVGFSTE